MELRNPILHTGAPTNIISSRLVWRLGFLPAGVESIKSNGAYSSVPLRFDELVVTYPAAVLESDSYDILIGTDLLRTYQTEISHLHGNFSILGYTVPLFFKDSSDVFLYPHGVLGLLYRVANASVKPLPTYNNNQKGIKMRSIKLVRIPPKTQVAVDTGLYLDLSPGLHLEISSINSVSRKEPLAAPGIRDSAEKETLKVLLLNPLSTVMKVFKEQHMAILRIGHNEDFPAICFLGRQEELGISLPEKPLVAAIIP
ncbi:hypothetical protein DSO57_1025177 [Entomophthora muscae]|uniref:Uncharacterized protein n=1 Tax=Entomophthora muscae TaxID=34485 RepID=A0ACC2SRG5_9FUNG|nr:hypothetical protein DSO57_1025177 [Entomophthora muscae]